MWSKDATELYYVLKREAQTHNVDITATQRVLCLSPCIRGFIEFPFGMAFQLAKHTEYDLILYGLS